LKAAQPQHCFRVDDDDDDDADNDDDDADRMTH
jgi:hypothetical protein